MYSVTIYAQNHVLISSSQAREGEEELDQSQSQDSLLDLISGYGNEAEAKGDAAGVKGEKQSSGNRKGGQK